MHVTKELAYECKGKLEICLFGYDDDPRELFEIEEVRQYVALLDEALPELFFFVPTGKPASTLRLFIFCLMPVSWEGDRSTRDVTRRVIVDLEPMGEFLERHFVGLNLMSEWVGLTEIEIERISESALSWLGYVPEGAEG